MNISKLSKFFYSPTDAQVNCACTNNALSDDDDDDDDDATAPKHVGAVLMLILM
jgi:hypothetical protein